ncbi:alcohol dehydrogenase catalytic domain-containing protein [Nocardia seriolae]|uniref:L-iditol 2-dehydrogenase n=1 Tax=Nocardia seriolae TaxID=37332 RepID=A0A0B8N7S2_9NOCA|nr:alcohol dehydrogenase catalytic domain-containing protein [Nocardia seriolae]APA99971.1 L-iditol 2-dehydrogenase [Nocardia seriolae]MTJ64653.1 alcohol dehydrogenase catalytic domain-containing protein [Nocardia seriolae]MTJ73036.1 alcohol dehydrogenase catalytic domain-containing protein [Nocardia seriolae]MTJ89496.1 alcohol dehydrogenase catalytic domain-containing protein [Nocardia seriolae]MTK33471.1 alcohol dehydrogenase catalytic domain-containing protein [Nocardia seriolae]
MTATHRAIVRDGATCVLATRPTPVPGRGEIAVAPERVSLCGTDIQILRRDRDDPAAVVGHEGAARVAAVGDGVEGFAVGDRVVVNPTHPHDPAFLLGHNVEGLFQERVVIGASAVSGGLVGLLPPQLSPERATLVEPFAVVRYALSCLAAATPDTLVVYGDGLIGNLAALLAPHFLGPGVRVTVVHRGEPGFDWTAKHVPGVVNVLAAEDDTAAGERVAALVATHRPGTIAAIEAALTGYGSRLVALHPLGGLASDARSALLPGIDLPGVRQANTGGPWPPVSVTYTGRGHRLTLTGNRGVTTAALTAAAETLSAWPDSIDVLLSHVVGMSEGVRYINEIITTGTRIVDGELVLRLVVNPSS